MWHNRWILLVAAILLAVRAYPEQSRNVQVTTAHRTLGGVSTLSLYDEYLSLDTYDGLGLAYHHTTARYPSQHTTSRFYRQDVTVQYATVRNRAKTASIAYVDLQYAWGVMFPFKPVYGIRTALGPMFGVGFGMKSQSRNTNNPVNFDLTGDVLLAGSLTYDIPFYLFEADPIRLKAAIKTPLAGLQFAPARGMSYYELLTFGHFKEAVHFSSLHTKNAWSGLYTVDIPLNFFTVSLGVMHRYSLFKANDMMFKYNSWSFQAGCVFDMLIFYGNNRPDPVSILSVDR